VLHATAPRCFQHKLATTLSNSTFLFEEDLQEDPPHLFLDRIFNSNTTIEDLPKGHFHFERDELNEESTEVLTSEFL
jgi:hypothetical protein